MSDKSLQSIQDVVRIPLYQYENASRLDSIPSVYDQNIINLIPEKLIDEDTRTVKQQLSKRPALQEYSSLDFLTGIVTDATACSIRDFIQITAVYDVFVAAVYDNTAGKFYIIQIRPITGSASLIGAGILGGFNDSIFLSEISQASGGNLLPGVAVNIVTQALTSSKGYYAVTTAGVFGGVLNTITDTNYPANQTPALIPVGRFVNQRGTFYIASLDGRIWNSYAGQNDISTWANATSQIGSIKTDMYPDQVLGLERFKNNIVAFSRNSIEFFNDVGPSTNNPSTLATIDQAFIKFGALKPELIKNIDDTLYWVAYGSDGQTGLWKLDGYTPVKLSNGYVDSQIQTTAVNLNTYSFNLQSCIMNGKRQIFVNGVVTHALPYYTDTTLFTAGTYSFSTSDGRANSMVYNADDGTWWAWNYQSTSATPRFATSFASPTQGALYTQFCLMDTLNSDAAQVYTFRTDNNFKEGNSVGLGRFPMTTIAQVNPLWFGNEKRKRISKFKIIMNTIPIKPTGDSASIYYMYLVYQKDSLATLNGSGYVGSMVRNIDHPSSVGRYVINNLGMGRVWNFCLYEKSSMNVRYDSIELDIQQGSH